MFFGELPTTEAAGCFLAHSLKTSKGRVRKGQQLNDAVIAQLLEDGIDTITVARPDSDDVHEDEAARSLANALLGTSTKADSARTGRVNLYASESGMLTFKPDVILAINAIDPGITLATLNENLWVQKGRMIATVKIIPYAVANTDLQQVLALCNAQAKLSVRVPAAHRACLIQTELPGINSSMLDKTVAVTQQRLLKRNATLQTEIRCEHSVGALHETLATLSQATRSQPDWILIAGASAISDRADVVPAAIEAAGGHVDRYGLPVDPGNLLLLGKIGNTQVIGLPGCARSAKPNGFDQILDRLACGLNLDNHWLNSLSVGGLLGEILERPRPRVVNTEHRHSDTSISLNQTSGQTSGQQSASSGTGKSLAGVLLAAGSSRRFGDDNKLLAKWQGQSLASWSLQQMLKAELDRIVVVTGFQQQEVETTLRREVLEQQHHLPSTIEFVFNPEYSSGMASSIVTAMSALAEYDAVVVCLADMPEAGSSISVLRSTWQDNPSMCAFVPTCYGKRGNPVLITKPLFDSVLTLTGDTGARHILSDNASVVMEVPVDAKAVLGDIDTPQQLADY